MVIAVTRPPLGRARQLSKAKHHSEPKFTPEVWGVYPTELSISENFVLRNETADAILGRVASPGRRKAQRAVLFTTLRLGDDTSDEQVLGMISTFCYHLHRQGMLEHTLLITTDEPTVMRLRERGLPAFLDRAFPRRSGYITSVKPGDTYNRVSRIM